MSVGALQAQQKTLDSVFTGPNSVAATYHRDGSDNVERPVRVLEPWPDETDLAPYADTADARVDVTRIRRTDVDPAKVAKAKARDWFEVTEGELTGKRYKVASVAGLPLEFHLQVTEIL